jgi:hypothetical protein
MTAEQLGRRFGWLIRLRMRPLNGHVQLREQMRKDLFDIFDQVRDAVAAAAAARPELTLNVRIVDQLTTRVIKLMLDSVNPSHSDP